MKSEPNEYKRESTGCDAEILDKINEIYGTAPQDEMVVRLQELRDSLQVRLDNAASHLRVALSQSLPTDDQIIIQHMRDALACLEGK